MPFRTILCALLATTAAAFASPASAEELILASNGTSGYQIVLPDGFIACQCEECRKLYATGSDWEEKIWILHRDLAERLLTAVDEQAWVYVNGNLVREHSTASQNATIATLWEAPFTVDVPHEHIRVGAPNTLAVRVHNQLGNGGIWRPVLAQVLQGE